MRTTKTKIVYDNPGATGLNQEVLDLMSDGFTVIKTELPKDGKPGIVKLEKTTDDL